MSLGGRQIQVTSALLPHKGMMQEFVDLFRCMLVKSNPTSRQSMMTEGNKALEGNTLQTVVISLYLLQAD